MHSTYFSNKRLILSSILAIFSNKKIVAIKTSFLALKTKNTYLCNVFFDYNSSKLSGSDLSKLYFYYCY